MDTIGGKETILDALPQAVLVERIAEVEVGVARVFAQGRCGHAELIGRLKVFEDYPPCTVIASAAPVTFVHDDEIEEIASESFEQPHSTFVLSQSLIEGEVHLAAVHNLTGFNLVACVTKSGKDSILGLVHQNVAVGEVQDAWPSVLTCPVPTRVPQLPTQLERHSRLARTRSHG